MVTTIVLTPDYHLGTTYSDGTFHNSSRSIGCGDNFIKVFPSNGVGTGDVVSTRDLRRINLRDGDPFAISVFPEIGGTS